MIAQNIALYNHSFGVYGIAFFGLVCLGLVVTLILFVNGGKKKDQ